MTAKTETTTNKERHRMMKSMKNHKNLTHCTVAVVLMGLALLSPAALAQEKGAERLMNLMRPAPAPIYPAASPKTVPMSCPKCQDVVKQVPDLSAKAGEFLLSEGRPTKSVVRHLCEGCSTTVTTVGHGKAKKDIAQHTCTSCGADSKSCCSTAANGKPTPGM